MPPTKEELAEVQTADELEHTIESTIEEREAALRNGSPPTLLTVAEILDAPDLEEEVVYIPSWRGSVRVRGLSKQDQYELRKYAIVDNELDEARGELGAFVLGVVEPRFTFDMAEELRKKNAGAVDAVLKVIRRLSGEDEKAIATAKARFPSGSGRKVRARPGA